MTDEQKDNPPASFADLSELMQKMWNPFGVPIPGFGLPGAAPGAPQGQAGSFGGIPGNLPFPNPATLFPTLDPAEVGRKIDELKIVEAWLQMSLNMMRLSIKTMELQKASLETLRAGQAPG